MAMRKAANRVTRYHLSQHAAEDFSFHHFSGLVEVVINNGFRLDAGAVVDSGQQIRGVDRMIQGSGTGLV